MSISTMKKFLLTGTAIVAVAAISSPAYAADDTLVAPTTWASAGTAADAADDGTDAVTGDGVAGSTHLLTITNDGVADDSVGHNSKNSFTLGAVTGSTGGIAVTTGSANDLAVQITSGVFSGAAPISVTNRDADNAAAAVTITGALSNVGGGALTVTNLETTADKDVSLTIGGNTSIVGTTTLTAGAFAGASTTLTNNGATNTYTGAVTLNAGAGAGSNATLTLSGGAGTNTFTGGITLNDGTAGLASLTVSGAGAKVIAGTVDGAAAGEGTINTNSAALTTFNNNVGGASAATGLKAINMAGNGGTTFSGTTRAVTITATNTAGTNTLTGAATATALNLNGAGGTTALGAASSITTTTFGAAATLTVGGTLTGNIDFGGFDAAAVNVTDGFNITGNVDSASSNGGVLTLAGTTTVSGTVGATNNLVDIVASGAGGKTVAFTSAVKSDALHVNGAGTVNLNSTGTNTITQVTYGAAGAVNLAGNLTGAVNFAGFDAAALTIADGKSVSGAIDSTGSNGGVLTFSGASTVSSAIGATNNMVDIITTSGKTVGFGAATKTDAFHNSGVSNFTAGASTLGVITNAASGDLNISSAGLTSTGNITNAGDIVLSSGADLTSSGSFTNSGGTVTLGVGSVMTTNTVVAGTGTLTFGVKGGTTTTNGTLGQLVNAAAVDLTGQTVKVAVDQTAYLTNKSVFKVVDGAVGAVTGFDTTATAVGDANGDTALYTFYKLSGDYAGGTIDGNTVAAIGGDAQDGYIVAIQNSAAAVTGSSNDGSVAAAMNTIGTTGTTDLDVAFGKVAGADTAAELHDALSSLTPTVDGGAQLTTMSFGAQTQTITDTRLASLRSGDPSTGMAAGSSAQGISLWFEAYGQHANQDARSSVEGFSANTFGGAIGADSSELVDGAVVGLAVNYGRSHINSENANSTDTDVDNYGINLYGSYNLPEKMFVNGQLGYSYNPIETERHNADLAGNSAFGDTDSTQWTARADIGRDYAVDYGTLLTPSLNASYIHVSTDSYTETGAGGANLNVDSDSISAFNLGASVTAAWKLKTADGDMLKPSLHAGYAYDLVGDRVSASSSFTGDAAGTIFVTKGASPERNLFNVGGKLLYATTANWDFSANYDFQYKSDYDAHTGTLRATTHF